MSKNPSSIKSEGSKSEGSEAGPSGGRGGPKMSEGDWLCADAECANWNFAWRTSCNRCGAEKASSGAGGDSGGSSGGSSYSKKKKLGQEIGKAMAEKSRGLFSADDWQCNKCGNVNWARRHQCNVCNAPRFGEVEERTGYGGGYNDRGVVEYVERVESDDEWDEFGRKKKKFRKKENSESDDGGPHNKRRKDERRSSSAERESEANRKRDEANKRREEAIRKREEEVAKKREETKKRVEEVRRQEEARRRAQQDDTSSSEEEEEDDDDGDLSKYDLSGWGDEDAAK